MAYSLGSRSGARPFTAHPCPAGLDGRTGPRDGGRTRRHVLVDRASGCHIGSVAYGHRRNERDIGSDEGVFADGGAVLPDSVVVASDDAGADVGARPYLRISHVAQVGSGDLFAKGGVL